MTGEQHFDISQFGSELQRVLVVAAHPDDLETACGGTISLLIRQEVVEPVGNRLYIQPAR